MHKPEKDNDVPFFTSESQKKHIGRKVLNSTREVFLMQLLVLVGSFLLGIGIFSQLGNSKAASYLYVSTSGNDANSCTQAAPCKTLNRAYAVAAAGDTVRVNGGSYGSQTITGTKSSWVYFEPVSGATVTLGGLFTNADFIDIRDMEVSQWQITAANVNDVTLHNIDVKGYLGFQANGTNRISMYGGSVGPGVDYHPQIAPASGNGSGWASNILFDGVFWHDWTRTNTSVHTECLQVAGTTNFTMRNNTFERCAIFDLSFTAYNGSGNPTNVLLENNMFATTTGNGSINDGFYALNYSNMQGIVMKSNTFGQGINQGSGNSDVVLSGNILLSSWQCDGGTHNYNVYQWTSNLNCGTDKWVNGPQYSVSNIISGSATTVAGLRIGSNSPAKDFITAAQASSLGLPSSDVDGNPRPFGSNYDAGGDEYGSGGTSPSPTPPPPPPAAPVVTISASPSSLQSGNSSTITWSATNSPSLCTASGDWSGNKSASGSQSTGTLSTVKTYTYTLACSNAGGSDSASATVTVSATPPPPPAKPVITMSVSPATINRGSSSTIAWSATNSPSSCTASGDWSGSKSASGSLSTGRLNIVDTYTYSLMCSNSGGSTTGSVTLIVIPNKPTVKLSASKSTVNDGEMSTLSWETTEDPSTCTASGDWSGDKSVRGGTESTGALSNATSKTYTITCTNSGGSASDSTTISISTPEQPLDPNVAKPTVSISASPETIQSGQQATLTWKVSGADKCEAEDGWSGSKEKAGGTENTAALTEGTTYTLVCSNEGGSTSDSVSVSVVVVDNTTGEVKVNDQKVANLKVDNPAIVGKSKTGEPSQTPYTDTASNKPTTLGSLGTTKAKLTAAGAFAVVVTVVSGGLFAGHHYLHWHLIAPFRRLWHRGGPPPNVPPGMISG